MSLSRNDRGPAEATDVPVAPATAYGLLAAVILLWGFNWPVMKVGLESIPPFWFALARLSMGAATLFPILWLTGRLTLPRRGDLPVLFSVALLQMAGFLALINFGLLDVEAGRSAVLAYTTPLWVTPAAVWLLGERLTRLKAVGLALGLCGVAVLFNPLGFDWGDGAVLQGNLLLMLAALAWSGAILHVRGHRWQSSPLQLAPWQMLVASLPVAALAAATEGVPAVRWTGDLVLILAYNGPLATAFCYWAAVTVTRALPAISTSLGFLGVPVAGVIFSAAWLAEPLTLTLLGGLVLVVLGMALVNLPSRQIG